MGRRRVCCMGASIDKFSSSDSIRSFECIVQSELNRICWWNRKIFIQNSMMFWNYYELTYCTGWKMKQINYSYWIDRSNTETDFRIATILFRIDKRVSDFRSWSFKILFITLLKHVRFFHPFGSPTHLVFQQLYALYLISFYQSKVFQI